MKFYLITAAVVLALTGCGTVALQYQAGDGNFCSAKGSGMLGAHYANAQFDRCTERHPTARLVPVAQ